MNLKAKIAIVKTSIPLLGLGATLRILLSHLFSYDLAKDRSFDMRNGTDTTTRVERFELDISEEKTRIAAEPYGSCPPRFEEHILDTLEIPYQDFHFVDMGSGKGRVLMIASDKPFRSITGVDISQKLCATAEKNLRIYQAKRRRCTKVDVRCMDARTFQIEDRNTVFHFYHPFNREVFQPILENIASLFRSSENKVILVYIWRFIEELFPLFDELQFRRLCHIKSVNLRYQYAKFTM